MPDAECLSSDSAFEAEFRRVAAAFHALRVAALTGDYAVRVEYWRIAAIFRDFYIERQRRALAAEKRARAQLYADSPTTGNRPPEECRAPIFRRSAPRRHPQTLSLPQPPLTDSP